MAIEAIKGAGMVYQGSTSTAQVKEESQSKAEVSSKDNQIVSDTVAKETQAQEQTVEETPAKAEEKKEKKQKHKEEEKTIVNE
mgnify:CR=1 FL=1